MGNPIRHLEIIQQGNPAKEAIKGIELLEQTIKDSSKSIQKEAKAIADALKKVNTTTKKGQEETRKAAEKTKQLSVRQKENIRLSKELVKTKEKLRTAQGIVNKGLIANRIELNKVNKETKQNIVLSKSQKGSYDRLAVSLNKNIAKWKGMSEAERKNTSQGKKLTAQIKQQDAALKKLDKQIGRSQRNVGNYSSAFVSLGSAMGVTLGAAGIFMVLKNAIGVISGFEKEMAKVKAISGATASEFAALEKQAQDLGATTLFTAQQVATLEVAYSKLGFSTQEILNATAATLDLAVATDSDLAQAAEVAGATLRGFGLDAAEMTRVVDIMAKGFTTSALDIENFREAMKLVAPIAKAAGISLEITTNLLGKLADAGLKGSIGATGLKNILLELSNENSKLSKHLGFAVRNADDLQRAFIQLESESLNLADAQKLIDKRGQAALIALSSNKDIANLLVDAYDDVDGAARRMAETMEQTLSAKVTLLGSAWDGLILKFSETKGTMATVVSSITNALNTISASISATQFMIESGIAEKGFWEKAFGGKTAETEALRLQKNLLGLIGATNEELQTAVREAANKIGFYSGEVGEEMNKMYARYIGVLQQQILDNDKESVDAAKRLEEERKKAAEKAAAQSVKDKKAFNNFILEMDEDLVDEEIEIIGDGYDQEYLANKEKNENITEGEKELTNNLKEESDERLDNNLDNLDKQQKEEEKARKLKLQKQQAATDEMAMFLDNQYNTFESGLSRSVSALGSAILEMDELLKSDLEGMEKALAAISIGIAAIGAIGTAIFQQRSNEINEEMDQLQTAKAYELSLVEGNTEATAAINKKFAEDEKKLKIEKFKNDKKAAIFTAVINTALGITQALATLPPPISYIMAAITAAAGAIEIAAIASKPIPKFEKGGHGVIEGKRHSQGGVKIDRVGEVEKGEHFGVINRENTSKYANELPSIFDSLNNGNFEDIWQRTNDSLNVSVNDKYGKKMYNEMQKKETMAGGRRVVKKGNRTLYLN